MREHEITFPYHCPYSITVASGTVLINYLYQPQLEVKQIPDRSAIAPPRAKNMEKMKVGLHEGDLLFCYRFK